MSKVIWTEEVLFNVFLLLKEGYDYGEIAEMYGVTRSAVAGIVNRSWVGARYREHAGVAKTRATRFWTKTRRDRLAALYRQEVLPEVIMADLGITRHSMRHALTKFGLSDIDRGRRVAGKLRIGFRHSEESLALMRERAQERLRRPEYLANVRAAHPTALMSELSRRSHDKRRGFKVPPKLAAEYRHLVYTKKLPSSEAARVLGIEVRR